MTKKLTEQEKKCAILVTKDYNADSEVFKILVA